MALCLAHSLVIQKKFDPVDQMNRYCNWFNYGYMSSAGDCFDIGVTVSNALKKYLETDNPFAGSVDEYSFGCGSIMRLAPIPIFYHQNYDACIKYAGESSRAIHGSVECIEGCKLFASLIFNAFGAKFKDDIFQSNTYFPYIKKIAAIAKRDFLSMTYSEIVGSGYVTESRVSALWCFMNSSAFEECVLLAAN